MALTEVNSLGIKDLEVKTGDIAADAVTGAKIADDAIDSEHYANASIDHAHLANDCVDGDNIADDAINSEHYVDASIDHAHLANDCVDGDNISDDSIGAEHIADNAVGLAAMAGLARGKLIYGDASGDPAALAVGTNGYYLKSDGTDISWAEVSGGITEADQWRITADATGGGDPLTSNWERNDTYSDKIGTGMSESSGIFTFPSTGIWLVDARCGGRIDGDVSLIYCGIKFTPNNSSYSPIAVGYGSIYRNSGTYYGGASCSQILDISDTGNRKVAINFSGTNFIVEGNSGLQISGVTFIRLGDT